MNSLLNKAIAQERLTPAEGLEILKNVPWTEVVEAADTVRQAKLPGNRVGYTAFRIVNYTNVCEVTCSFCSFCRAARHPEAYVLSLDEIRQKTLEAKAKGADQIFLQGGVNKEIPLSYYTDVLKMLTQELGVKVRGFSPVELVRIAEFNNITLDELLDIFKDAGLSSVPGAGAEILSDRMRQILSPKKLPAQQWCDTLAACHKKGLPGSANIVIGSAETAEEVIEHLEYVRKTQDIAGGFKSFVVWTFQPQTDKFPIRQNSGCMPAPMTSTASSLKRTCLRTTVSRPSSRPKHLSKTQASRHTDEPSTLIKVRVVTNELAQFAMTEPPQSALR